MSFIDFKSINSHFTHNRMTFNNDVIESVNQDQNLIYQLQNQLLHQYDFIQIVQFHWSFFYHLLDIHIHSIIARINIYLFIYLFVRQFLQELHEYSIHYSQRKILKHTRLQIKLTCSFQFRSKQLIDSFVRISIYLSFAR